jgi:hypothetical protein
MFLCRVKVVYTRSSARNWVVTSVELDLDDVNTGMLGGHVRSAPAFPMLDQ